ncbi:MAG: hypothetical protein WHT46_03835 [Candidatus Geothermincolales bacterium]
MPESENGIGSRSKEAAARIFREPRLLALVSLASVPLNFMFYYLLPGTPAFLYFPLLLVGYSIAFCLLYFGWSRAAALFKEGDAKAASASFHEKVRPITRTGLAVGLLHVLGFMVAQTLTGFVLSYIAAGAGEGSAVALSVIYFYLAYLVADLVLVFLAVTPQVILYGKADQVEVVIRESYQWIRERYKLSLALYIIPDLVARTLYLGVSLALYYLPRWEGFLVVLLILMAILEGAKITFIAAAFQGLYGEGERKKRKQKGSRSSKAPGK